MISLNSPITKMGRKRKETEGAPAESPYVTVKLGRREHGRLRIICNARGRDLADLLTEIARPQIDAMYKIVLKELGDDLEGESS